jgi:4-amino-4-deoxy-L-arabinose transferase-like glycosyltransferase
VSSPLRRALALLLLGSLLVGLGHLALLPPFEGFDETAHYSYVQQLAETGHWPRHGDKMSTDIDDYLRAAPTAESMHGAWTYQAFFAAPPPVINAGRHAVHARPAAARRYTPGMIENWQAQHPPLYYAVLAPAYLISNSASLGSQLLLLRALSYLIAWAGLCVVVVAALRTFPDRRIATLLPLGAALWPAIFSGWFPEMGRLGNDSLITVFAALTFVLLYRLTTSPGRLRDYALLGGCVALALLTKATFLPVAAAVLLVLGGLAVRTADTADDRSQRRKGMCVAVATIIVGAGWWYLLQMLGTGSVIGSNDVIKLRASGGLLAGLAKHFDAVTVMRAPWDLAASFLWPGTWSFVQPPRLTVLPIAGLAAVLAFGCYRVMRQQRLQPIEWFPPATLALFAAALVYHSVVLFSFVGAVAPTWYLHSLAPILALLVGYAIAGTPPGPWQRRALTALCLYALAFLAALTIVNALYYAGCGAKLPDRQYFAWSTGVGCIANPSRLYDNLAVLATPGIGITLFLVGWCLLVIGVIRAIRCGARMDATASH